MSCLLAVFAHPDDETFRPGGTLALLARQGVRVQVLTATRGQAGSCGDPPLCTPEELHAVREGELRCACAVLGLEPPRLLDYDDGGLAKADPEQITMEILAIVNEIRPQVLLSFGPDGLSGHLDHITIGQCAAQAWDHSGEIAARYTIAIPRTLAEQLEMRQIHPVPDEQISQRVDISPAWEVKRAAMDCHATQRAATPLLSMPVERQRLFFGCEYFVRAACREPKLDFMPEILKGYCL